MQKIMTLTLLIGLTSGCGNDDGAGGDPDAASPVDSAEEAIINGKPASEFYGQFVWEEIDSYNFGAANFTEVNGRNAYLVHLFLMEDQRAFVFYDEGIGNAGPNGFAGSTFNDSKVRVETTWSISGTDLRVGSTLLCGGLEFNGEDRLQCGLVSTLFTSAAVGPAAILRRDTGDSAPSDNEWSDYE